MIPAIRQSKIALFILLPPFLSARSNILVRMLIKDRQDECHLRLEMKIGQKLSKNTIGNWSDASAN
jgi:hypothetical protein